MKNIIKVDLNVHSVLSNCLQTPKTADSPSFTILQIYRQRWKTFLPLSVTINTTVFPLKQNYILEVSPRQWCLCSFFFFLSFSSGDKNSRLIFSNITHSFLYNTEYFLLPQCPSPCPPFIISPTFSDFHLAVSGHRIPGDAETAEASRPSAFLFKKLKLHHSTQFSQVMRIYRN